MNCNIAKAIASFFVSVIFAVSLVGCSGGNSKLSNDQAQSAVWTVMNGVAEDVTVIGVREIPQQNLAQVDLHVKNWRLLTHRDDSLAARGTETFEWSGEGTATFVHYNDGWVLTHINTEQQSAQRNDLHVAVK
jgi:hypothetical protein